MDNWKFQYQNVSDYMQNASSTRNPLDKVMQLQKENLLKKQKYYVCVCVCTYHTAEQVWEKLKLKSLLTQSSFRNLKLSNN